MDKFLDESNQPKLNKEDINHLNKSAKSHEIEVSPNKKELNTRWVQG
jgi:hypothetical protein